jgi:uncharacterized protein (DUF924 family)
MALKTPNDVLSYWFGDIEAPDFPRPRPEIWWGKDEAVDAKIKADFSETLIAAGAGELAGWKNSPRGLLGHIILLDQLSRNMHRNSPDMYALDGEAQDLVMLALENDTHLALTATERSFLYMPLMHAENLALQRLGVRLFAQAVRHAPPAGLKGAEFTLDYAKQHEVIVGRFGRFPHRNEILGRTSTPEEIAFLKEPGSSF